MITQEKVIVLAGTKSQIPLIKRLKEMGYYVININPFENSPAFKFADEFVVEDILNKNRILEIAKENSVIAVMSEMCDIAVPTIAYISEKLNLRGISRGLARLYTDKFEMRKFCKINGFKYPEYSKCFSEEEVLDFFKRIEKKIIIKPLDANSSRGVYIICKEEDIVGIFEKVVIYSKIEKAVICEEYIEGVEFTADGIVTDKTHVTLAISEKKHYKYNENIACELLFTNYNNNYDYDRIRELNDRFVNMSGLNIGITHAEYKYSNGDFYLIEIAARGGGNFIASDIVPYMSGIDIYKYLILESTNKIVLPELTTINHSTNKYMVLKFFDFAEANGVVKQIKGVEILENSSNVVKWDLNIKSGDTIKPIANDSDRRGYYILSADSISELTEVINIINDSIEIII